MVPPQHAGCPRPGRLAGEVTENGIVLRSVFQPRTIPSAIDREVLWALGNEELAKLVADAGNVTMICTSAAAKPTIQSYAGQEKANREGKALTTTLLSGPAHLRRRERRKRLGYTAPSSLVVQQSVLHRPDHDLLLRAKAQLALECRRWRSGWSPA